MFGSSCAHESVRGEHEMRVEALHSTFLLQFPFLAKILLARSSWQGLLICQVFRWRSSGQAFLGSSLCKIQRKPVQDSSISGLGSRLEAYSIRNTLTGDQGILSFLSDKSFYVSHPFFCETKKDCFGKSKHQVEI